ncbi:MAG: hypothetical protein IKQ37_09295 [Bacteroidaceae bacterium]|nr:hypothetical protein [Bacteroidaceae bacterium]
MKKLGAFLIMLSVAAGMQSQDKASLLSRMNEKDILNHIDVGVNAGTMGIGVDVAVPVGKYVRVRAGYNYMPRFCIHSDFSVQTSNGGGIGGSIQKFINKKDKIYDKLEQYNIDITDPGFSQQKACLDKITNGSLQLKDYVTMGLKPNLHQFKFLVDVMPFKNNKHWSFTAGFFVGPSDMAEACNLDSETALLEAVDAYNDFYIKYISSGKDIGFGNDNSPVSGEIPEITKVLTDNGIAGFKLGQFKDGDQAIMVPGKGGVARAEMRVNKVRPYFGIGYNTALSKNEKWKLTVDAGVMILGKPGVYVNNVYKINTSLIDTANEYYDIIRPNADWTDYVVDMPLQNVNMVTDLHNISGKVGDMAKTLSKFKAYPNISVSVSYRIF